MKMKHFVVQESGSRIPQVMPAANEMNDYEDIIAVVSDDNDNSQQEQARKKSKTGEEDSLSYLFQLDQPVSLQDILGQDQTLPSHPHLGGSSSHYVAPQTLITNTKLNPNLSERINISVSTGIIVPNPSIFSSTSTFSLPVFPKTTGYSFTQFESPNFPVQPYATFGTAASASALVVGNYETQLQSPSSVHSSYAAPSVGSAVAANNLDGNSLTQFQSPRLVHPHASSSGHQALMLVVLLLMLMLMLHC